ncbi:MAG: anaerobic glycerol-3-phosphate dehydrogenase subunit GlpB [Peptococcales bacterium]|jgi:glycerol-3-phosphate dehydrogenase subunit B
MTYDVVVIGAGLAGFSAALAAVEEGKKTLVVAQGMGNLYSASGYIDFLGYYPTTSSRPVTNPSKALEQMTGENPEHPYAKVGRKAIVRAFDKFLEASQAMGLPYGGSLDENLLLPTAAGALVPTALYPQSAGKNVLNSREKIVVGITELVDFYPAYVAENLEKQLGHKVKAVWVDLRLKQNRELNSYDLALTLEKPDIRNRLITELKKVGVREALVLIPAVLGVSCGQEVINDLEDQLQCDIMEIPTLPPSVMGYRLAEKFKLYLKKKGVEFIIGHPVVYTNCLNGKCTEVGISTINGRLKRIGGTNFCLATGGILGEGLKVSPHNIKEQVFDLPVKIADAQLSENFFSLEAQALAQAGLMVNDNLQPINSQTGEVILSNVFVAGATLAGYDPFLEKSGNGVALASGFKAGLLAAKGGKPDE